MNELIFGEQFGLETRILSDGRSFFTGWLPAGQVLQGEQFERLWELHPREFREITMVGRRVKLPRFQQAYARDYEYRGEISPAVTVPEILEPLLAFVKAAVDSRLNGLLVNWYDAALGHYIGPHRDSTVGLVAGSPIVMCSFGDERIFRLKAWRGSDGHDFRASSGSIFVLPYETNAGWTHEIPKARASAGRRVSVTIRAFE